MLLLTEFSGTNVIGSGFINIVEDFSLTTISLLLPRELVCETELFCLEWVLLVVPE